MWKQSFWFALFGSLIAVLTSTVRYLPARGESFSMFDGGTTFTSRYVGRGADDLVTVGVAGAVLGALIGFACYWSGIRVVSAEGNRVGRVVFAGLLGVVVGLSPVLLMIATPPPLLLVLYGVSALIAYAAALFAIGLVLRASGDEHARRTTRCVSLILPVGALVATAAGMGTAWLHDFSTRTSTVVVVVLVVALVLSATFAAARSWALHLEPSQLGG